MGELITYSTLEQKTNNFAVSRIDTKKQFDEFYEKLTNTNSIWRGLSESKYKHYSSLQRFWITQDLQTVDENVFDYLLHISKHALSWNNSLLKKFYRYTEDRYIDLTLPIWSILRHHNTPTPLLDWSKNPKIALYFSCDFKGPKNQLGKADIENYCSLYEICDGYDLIRNYNELVEPLLDDLKKLDKANGNNDKIPNINELIILYLKAQVEKELPIFYKVDDMPNQISAEIKNSYNILSQEGLFLLNVDPITPLEEMPKKQFDYFSINGPRTSRISQADLNKRLESIKNKFKCYEIHKGLRPYALEKLSSSSPSIREGTVFPDLYAMAEEASESFLKKN